MTIVRLSLSVGRKSVFGWKVPWCGQSGELKRVCMCFVERAEHLQPESGGLG